jgi:hypothetical protein
MKKLTTLLLISILYWNNLSASHLWGADLNFTCMGNSTYLVTYTFYRDCFGIVAPTTFPLIINNACGFPSSTYTLNYISIEPLLKSCYSQSTCNGGSIQGIEKYIYQATVTLPDTCSSWTLGVTNAARNPGVLIFQNPSNNNLYVEATINNTESCDTSTVFFK